MNITELCDDYAAATEEFFAAVARVSSDQLDRHRPGEWSARQVIHHMADSETQSYARLRRLLAEGDGTSIQGYDEARWADADVLGYRELPVDNSLAVIRAVRTASLETLRRLSGDDLARWGEHSQSGRYSVATWCENYREHPRAHAAQIAAALAGEATD
jgi:DinB superfamily